MSEIEKQPVQPLPKPDSGFPKKMIIFSGFVVCLVFCGFLLLSKLDDWFGIGLDIVMVLSAALSVMLIVCWVVWFLLMSQWMWWNRVAASVIAISIPLVFMSVFRPIIGGDANIIGFAPIWASPPEVPSDVVAVDVRVDLSKESDIDFPRFLGSNQNATVTGVGELANDSVARASVLWKQSIGQGWSGFVARNGFVVTMEQRDEYECVTCYSVDDGQLEWIYKHAGRHRDKINMGGVGPRSTPAIHNGNVYAVGALGNFVCLNGSNGEVIWQQDLNAILGIELESTVDRYGFDVQYEKDSSLAWGRSGSPLIVDDMVVVPGGGVLSGPKTTLLAFDAATGKQRWSGGDQMVAYGSPVLAKVAGVQQILMVSETSAMGFAPDNGKELWRFSRPGQTDGQANTSQLSVVSANEVLTTKGYPDGGGRLIRLDNNGGTIVPESVWHKPLQLKTKLMSPLIYNGHAYALSNAFLECTRLSDGKRLWKHRGRFGHGQMLLVNDQILLHSELGTLYQFKASPEGYEEIGQLKTIEGVCWNNLCLYGNRLLVRSELEAACIELPMQ